MGAAFRRCEGIGMSEPHVRYMELPCAPESDGMLDAPKVLRVRLDAKTIRLLESVIRRYEISTEKERPYLAFDFPGKALEYLREGASGLLSRWDRDFENSSVSADGEEVSFASDVLNGWGDRAEEVLHATVSYERLNEEIRKWRAVVMSDNLAEAMPGDDAPAAKQSSGMSPL